MDEEVLGHVYRLDVQPDEAGSKQDKLLRDRLTCEVLRLLGRLPASIDAAGLRQVAQEVLGRYARVVAQVQGGRLPVASVIDLDMAAVAVSLLQPALGVDGYSLLGFCWRLVPREAEDAEAYRREVADADLRLARWLQLAETIEKEGGLE